ncbi:MAG: haloacid dehalogenase [Ruminococcaceae bacterium]|nr:haloacid dehalogenase [Oscillospiraceae bacterium]
MKAILFDFDGVLTIDKYGSDSILRYLAEKTQVPIDILKREYYKINRGLLNGEYTHKDIWADYCKNVGYDIDFQILIDSFINTPLDWDMILFVRELKIKYKIGMITDNKVDRITKILEHHNLTDLFDIVTISAECKCGKNDRKIFDITLDYLNIEPNNCIFIDNSEKNLIVPQELGIHTFLFDDENRDIEKFENQLNKLL